MRAGPRDEIMGRRNQKPSKKRRQGAPHGRRAKPSLGNDASRLLHGAPRWPEPVAIDAAELAAPDSTRALLARWEGRADPLAGKLAEFITLLLTGNQVCNLTGAPSPRELWARHVEDALHGAAAIEAICGAPSAETRILDVGAGGGLPGMIWAILWPEARVDLLDATEKKVHFMRWAAERLGLGRVRAVHERAETLGVEPAWREQYDWVSARGVASLQTLAEWTVPFVKLGGRMFAIKGADVEAEFRDARRAYRLLGVPEPPRLHAYTRADGKQCTLVEFIKREWTPSPYPRRASVAARIPL